MRTFDFGAVLRGLAAFVAAAFFATFADVLDALPAIVWGESPSDDTLETLGTPRAIR